MHQIRRASPAEVETIVAITDAAYAKYIPLIGRKPLPMLADYARMQAENSIWLLYADDAPAGLIVIIDKPDHALIYSVAIAPDYQQRGFGPMLIAHAEQHAILQGYAEMRLYTNERFETNIQLYKRLGYRKTHTEAVLNSITIHMAKALVL